MLLKERQPLIAIGRREHAHFEHLQRVLGGFAYNLFVVDHEHEPV